MNFLVEYYKEFETDPFKHERIKTSDYKSAWEEAESRAKAWSDQFAENISFDVNEDEEDEPEGCASQGFDERCGAIQEHDFGCTVPEIGVEGPYSLEEVSGHWKDYYGGWISPDNQVYLIQPMRHLPSIMAVHCDNKIPLPAGNVNRSYRPWLRIGWTRVMSSECSTENGGLRGKPCQDYGISVTTMNVTASLKKVAIAFEREIQEYPKLKASVDDYSEGGEFGQYELRRFLPSSMQELIQSTAGVREVYDAPGEFSVYGNNPPRYEHEIEYNPYLPNSEAQAIAQQYVAQKGFPPIQDTGYVQVDPRVSRQIAQAFQDMPDSPNDLLTRAAYQALANEVEDQFALLPVQVVSTTEYGSYPYKTSQNMMDDIMQNRRIVVFDGGDDHSLLSREEQFKFRAVHDYFGHAQHGFAFGPRGEENAWLEHSKMFSPLARLALTSETRGQNSWVNFGPHSHLPVLERPYADQKVGVLPMEFQLHPEFILAYERWPGFLDVEHQIRQVAMNPSQLLSAYAEKFSGTPFGEPEQASEGLFAYSRPKVERVRKQKACRTGPRQKLELAEYNTKLEEVLHLFNGNCKQAKIFIDIMPQFERVKEFFSLGQEGLHWYEETPQRILSIFNYDRERTNKFIGFLAATSPLRNIVANVKLALKALHQSDNGAVSAPDAYKYTDNDGEEAYWYECQGPDSSKCFFLDMPNHISNAVRVVKGEPLSGPKVSAFFKNLTEPADQDSGAVTVDTWMLRAFRLRGIGSKEEKKSNAPSDNEYAAVQKAIQLLAEEAGVLPRQYQAAVWVGIKEEEGDTDADTADPFDVVLFRQIDDVTRQEVFTGSGFPEMKELPEVIARREKRRGKAAQLSEEQIASRKEWQTYGPFTPELARDIGPEEGEN